ncbi:hypothetical protein C8J57DRAFT_1252894 [Mycena rebaudengoi]|nr:hypothetical protein C8J57DRAFT_1252894 [Mycena rebaudengoi]
MSASAARAARTQRINTERQALSDQIVRMAKELAGPRPANSQNSRLGYDCVNQLTLSFGKTRFSTIGRYFSKCGSQDHRRASRACTSYVAVSPALPREQLAQLEQLWVQYYLTRKKWGAEEIPPHLLFPVAPVHIGPAPTLVPIPPPLPQPTVTRRTSTPGRSIPSASTSCTNIPSGATSGGQKRRRSQSPVQCCTPVIDLNVIDLTASPPRQAKRPKIVIDLEAIEVSSDSE